MRKTVVGALICCIIIGISPLLAIVNTTQANSMSTYPDITIVKPEAGKLYVWGIPMANLSYNRTLIIGPILVQAGVTGINGFEVDFWIDGVFQYHDDSWPFEYAWITPCFGIYLITAKLTGYDVQDSIKVFKIL